MTEQETPLILAVETGRLHVAEKLLSEGAKIGVKGCNGRTALHNAMYKKDEFILDLLINFIKVTSMYVVRCFVYFRVNHNVGRKASRAIYICFHFS